ncbi:hypothetical protein [Parachryseolinea silvisoli]|uniref:hypothetical protein n=1 Tax=Parachryseolinea silvisoli TaxID=2873601 RepID=UPI002265A3C6|nr:hypothetical protein [Parachryseolinea silvisoli]MCD9019772.1 hypothetical protein [Parachryseolinea silvisoli]
MLGGLLVLVLTGLISFAVIGRLKRRHPVMDAPLMRNMYWWHILLSFAYLGYVAFNPSDSRAYYHKVESGFRGDTWGAFYGTSTTFIEFVGYPFIRYLGFSYEAMMALFSFLGFLGFLYFYIFFRENIRFKHQFMGYDLLTLTFFLPNLHFWSSSFGKGSIIFLGLGLYFFGISNVRKRLLAVAIGGLIIYHVRPHIMLVLLVSSAAGFIFSSRGVSVAWRVLFLLGASVAFFFIYRDVLSMVGIDEEQFISQGLDMSRRAKELTKASSGVDITQYSLPMQVFTFLYRPLFVDAPGVLGIIVSFENVFYVAVTLKILTSLRGIKFLFTGDFLAKSAFFSFLTVSVALAQIAGNLGLAMRQKSQVMILLLFVVLSYMEAEKRKVFAAVRRRTPVRRPQPPSPSTTPAA